MKKFYAFKTLEAYPQEMQMVDPFLAIVFHSFVSYAFTYKQPVRVTRIFQKVEGESGCHQDGRGIDVSDKGWDTVHIHRVLKKLNVFYPTWGTSSNGKNNRVIIHHKTDTGVMHFHLQVRRGLKFEENFYGKD